MYTAPEGLTCPAAIILPVPFIAIEFHPICCPFGVQVIPVSVDTQI
jgi:hypothetical protein